MVTHLLVYHIDQWVDEVFLVFLSIFAVRKKPSFMFNYKQFLSDIIHEQLLKFKVEGVFKHQSVLVYLILFYQAYKFKFQFQRLVSRVPHYQLFIGLLQLEETHKSIHVLIL